MVLFFKIVHKGNASHFYMSTFYLRKIKFLVLISIKSYQREPFMKRCSVKVKYELGT